MKKQFQNWAWCQGMKFNTKVHDLTYFFWETTLCCNLNCLHCGSDCDKDKRVEDLPKEKVLKVFKNIAENYEAKDIMVAVTGGEPLVRKDLFEILSEVNNMGFPWGMVTNGMLVDEKIVEKCVESGMRTVSVSLDGTGETHNWLRNNEMSYERAINALKLFLKAGKFDIVEVITCVNTQNINQLEDIYKLLKNLGVHGWRLFTIFPKGRAEVNGNLIFNKNLLTELFSFIKEKRNSNSGIYISYSEEGYLGCNWEKEVRDDFFFCGAGINIGSLLADGSYSACPSLSRDWIQGHVDEISFSEAWESRYRNMRNRRWMRTGDCKSCRQWSKCNGSSLHLWDFKEKKTKVCHFKMLND
ncbi:radical SAM protein [Clostridium bovifaecis]|uniref:Radical SAM protein n=1 Tax=Clostridium bovifaecis TaxID=2184719 RepID=A0A6I6EQK8_9CLOT|nr:radical SAM protein [Clostridium bovifaecis]